MTAGAWTRTDMDARTERLLAGVQPEFAAKVRRILAVMAEAGHPMTVTSGNRTTAEQQALYAQGRTTPGKRVTNIDGVRVKSNHQDGRAVDCAFLDSKGRPTWPETGPWTLYGEAAEAEGLVWGGRWKTLVDRPHIELPKGSTTR